ncbi:MAG: ABC transporter permease [Clostridia bacterium]|nr:ABC transporter permease [Clostridia bacterium]
MYIIKNAFRCISRSKGRNILIGIIALVIAVSACIGLSIRQAAESAKTSALEGMSVTATISYDRGSMMQQMGGGGRGQGGGGGFSFDRNQFADMMGKSSSLTLDEYKKYAEAESVQDFYYTLTAYFNGSDDFQPVSDETEEETEEDSSESLESGRPSGFPGGMMMGGGMFSSGDFTVVGYSSDSSMLDFINGTAYILEGGTMFEEGTTEYVCVISEELALYNGLDIDDAIVITNPSLESETYTLTISGIYSSSETNDFSMSMFGKSQDPANKIYVSANALQLILDASEDASTTITDEDTGRESQSKITGTLSATYSFADTDDYYKFEDEARALGLGEAYTISSSDISSFENSLAPLKTLSTMAGWFLIVILVIGGIILVVLNIFNVRERKYEVGVLTAMGMKKWKVALQFMCEILVVTMIAVMIGAVVGAVSSVPVTNALLAGQVESQNSQQSQVDQSFGRPGNMGGGFPFGDMGGGMPSNMPSDKPEDIGGGKNPFENMFGGAADYITEVDSAMNLTVVFQMLGVGLLLTLVASAASVTFIMRYDPLKILANRD